MTRLPFPFPVVQWQDEQVVLIDQTLLPQQLAYRCCGDIPTLCTAIRELAVRGAPAIGVAAAYGLAMSWRAHSGAAGNLNEILGGFRTDFAALAATRPTAVNLFWALERIGGLAESLVDGGADPSTVAAALLQEADTILAEDIAMCRALGRAGAELLPEEATVLTHCNAGGLATGGYGTAIGVIYAAREMGKKIHVYADETRPLLQGARLTAWELADQGMDVTLLCDSAAASVLRRGKIDAVITGADRIAANGDSANKIGTYPLAVLARRHQVPFYIAAPISTFDPATAHGDDIEIEERASDEVACCHGLRTAPVGIAAYNPAFDVTPAELITAIITDLGVMRPPYTDSLEAWASAGESK